MKRFQEEHRVDYGVIDGIEWSDLTEVKRMREMTEVDAPVDVHWSWDYVGEVEQLRRLYEIGKVRQWNAEEDLDWDEEFGPQTHWGLAPKFTAVGGLLQQMGADEKTLREACWESLVHACSQLLHGEQAALHICGQLTNVCPDMDMKFFAGSQVIDEVRHIEALSKFITRKMGRIYPIDPNVKFLLEQILQADSWQKKTLGMQTLFEGMALGIMTQLARGSDIPFFKKMIQYIKLDESRHAAFGIISMRKLMDSSETDPEMKNELEDWAFNILECLNAGQFYGQLSELGPKYGIAPSNVARMLYAMPEVTENKRIMYTHAVVPHLRKLGLITERTAERYYNAGMIADPNEISEESNSTDGAWDSTPVRETQLEY